MLWDAIFSIFAANLNHMRKLIIVAISLVVLVSCKNETKQEKTTIDYSGNFTLTIDVLIEKNDVFQLFYNEDASDMFIDQNSKIIEVLGSSEFQTVSFEFPENAFPRALRFDISSNPEQDAVKFGNIKIKYFEKNIEINGSDFSKYFFPINQTVVDNTSGSYKLTKDEKVPYDPILLGTQDLKDLLKTLY
jgi:hypothetical protein